MKGYIYRYISPSGKSYIGQTTTNPSRRANGGVGYQGCTAFYNAIQKYGWENFQLEILQEVESDNLIEELNQLEIDYIQKLNTLIPFGYNMLEGGNNKSLRGLQSAQWRKDINDDLLKQLYLEERKSIKEVADLLNIPQQTIARHLDVLNIKKNKKYNEQIDQFYLNGDFIKTWDSAAIAGRTLNIDQNAIRVCCRKTGRRKSAGGYRWAIHGELPI